jgi:hypothetical protein
MNERICFIAAPLIARSGVYNSTIELVRAARAAGMDWSAVIGTSRQAGGTTANADGVRELEMEAAGLGGIMRLSRLLGDLPEVQSADLLVSMIPQTDMALSLTRRRWVAYLRGLPWPAPGEASRVKTAVWRTIERLALSRATEVWATTPILAADVGRGRVDELVPPGLVPPDVPTFSEHRDEFVWAARYSADKNPHLFMDALRDTPYRGIMFGSGPLERDLISIAPKNVTIAGWRPRSEVWTSARAYVGTSTREAFGRSAVEAAMLGIPVVISDAFGCADMLYTDADLAALFILPVGETERWQQAVHLLAKDDSLHAHAARHLVTNASTLTVHSAVANVAAASAGLSR